MPKIESLPKLSDSCDENIKLIKIKRTALLWADAQMPKDCADWIFSSCILRNRKLPLWWENCYGNAIQRLALTSSLLGNTEISRMDNKMCLRSRKILCSFRKIASFKCFVRGTRDIDLSWWEFCACSLVWFDLRYQYWRAGFWNFRIFERKPLALRDRFIGGRNVKRVSVRVANYTASGWA